MESRKPKVGKRGEGDEGGSKGESEGENKGEGEEGEGNNQHAGEINDEDDDALPTPTRDGATPNWWWMALL